MISRFSTSRKAVARRLVSLVVLLSLILSYFPLPLYSNNSAPKDRSEAFPCQDRPCGCRTAEQCRTSCCCFTEDQKLAWFEKQAAKKSDIAQSIACQISEPAKASCCQQKEAENCREENTPEQSSEESKTRYVLGLMAQKCQGNSYFWNSLPWAALPEQEESVSAPVVITTLQVISYDSLPQVFFSPPVPPPRSSDSDTKRA